MLDKAIEAQTVTEKQTDLPKYFWGADRYGLNRSQKFLKLDKEQQESVLGRLSDLNLSLSYFIERSGHNYGAKMILLSETQEEKSLYALFASEEAIHQREFEHFLSFQPKKETHWHPMLDPLGNVIQEGEKDSLLFVIQVLLEGFGMSFYGGLNEGCLFAPLKKAYDRILFDEARHHGTGLILSKEATLSQLAKDQIFEYSREFIQSLQSAGWIKEAMENHCGHFSKKEEATFWEELGYEKMLADRRLKLKTMIQKVDSIGLVSKLEKDNVL